MKLHYQLACLSLSLATLTISAHAQSQPANLYQSLGEKPGLVALMDDFFPRLLQNRHTQASFSQANAQHVKAQLVEQFCQLAGGPCQYKGPDMKTAHVNVDVSKAQFNALVEELQRAMSARGIAFGAQNQLLAKLAPMHRDVINTP